MKIRFTRQAPHYENWWMVVPADFTPEQIVKRVCREVPTKWQPVYVSYDGRIQTLFTIKVWDGRGLATLFIEPYFGV